MSTAFATLVRRTPLVAAPGLGPEVFLKLENLQRIGSFKLRGACLALDALSPEQRARGVVTASAGNHGQGVAVAASHLGIAARVVVPTTTPGVKKRAIAGYGAELVEHGDTYDAAEAAARALAAESGALFVSAFDHDDVIRGNGGTLGEELREQRPGLSRVIVPVGGGGMIAGLAEALSPSVAVVGAQPEANCAMFDSLAAGRALVHYAGEPTLAEGCEGGVAERTYAIVARHKLSIGLCSEDGIRRAMAWLYRTMGVVAEPSGAVAVAAWQEGAFPPGPAVIVVSGGNVEPGLLDEVLAA